MIEGTLLVDWLYRCLSLAKKDQLLLNFAVIEYYTLTQKHFSLKNKITKSGQAFEDTQANFRQRDFNQTIEQSGANKLGDAIRAHLRKSYKIGPAGDSSNTTTMGLFNS